MNGAPRITATITIVETGEKHEVEFTNVLEMLESMFDSVYLAEMALGRTIQVAEVDIEDDRDDAHFTYRYEDTNELYMTVDAHRHLVQ